MQVKNLNICSILAWKVKLSGGQQFANWWLKTILIHKVLLRFSIILLYLFFLDSYVVKKKNNFTQNLKKKKCAITVVLVENQPSCSIFWRHDWVGLKILFECGYHSTTYVLLFHLLLLKKVLNILGKNLV